MTVTTAEMYFFASGVDIGLLIGGLQTTNITFGYAAPFPECIFYLLPIIAFYINAIFKSPF